MNYIDYIDYKMILSKKKTKKQKQQQQKRAYLSVRFSHFPMTLSILW